MEVSGMCIEIEQLKQVLGLGFAGSVVAVVESQKKVIDDLKAALGLPEDASPEELQERISVIKAEHEEFSQKKSEWEARSAGFWQKLFGAK
jgi:polyhydroxyalkanoate synthesis regulator phasin